MIRRTMAALMLFQLQSTSDRPLAPVFDFRPRVYPQPKPFLPPPIGPSVGWVGVFVALDAWILHCVALETYCAIGDYRGGEGYDECMSRVDVTKSCTLFYKPPRPCSR